MLNVLYGIMQAALLFYKKFMRNLKTIEFAGYVRAIAGDAEEPFNFRAGLRIQSLVEHIQRSSRERNWIETPE